jgi:hypothetical protein
MTNIATLNTNADTAADHLRHVIGGLSFDDRHAVMQVLDGIHRDPGTRPVLRALWGALAMLTSAVQDVAVEAARVTTVGEDLSIQLREPGVDGLTVLAVELPGEPT